MCSSPSISRPVATLVAIMQNASCGVRTLIACQLRFSTSTIDLFRMSFMVRFKSVHFFRGVCSLLQWVSKNLVGAEFGFIPLLMNFPQFWARAQNRDFICWRWSFNNVAEAEALAAQALEQLMARFKSGEFPARTHGGYYPNRPFREQVIREIKDASGETSAVITRNSYG